MFIGMHYIIRNGKEHTIRKIEFFSKKDLFDYMWDLRTHELPFKWVEDRREKKRKIT